ncbi:DUF3540 domain-containing protein [Marinospirillum perlucidum]|uniref:DUF3540 domain-containing protein n=1 Tax=Marinospirillum perlucidum TaxID=1982602 RepID=UPI000DF38613|nr:DUF3540 domain-containing protein [Marinospirillum perlucidum]
MSLQAFSPQQPAGPEQAGPSFTALVQGGKEGRWLLSSDSGVLRARQAYSCLVQPALGDRVLVQQVGSDYYLLAILERQQPQPLRIRAHEGMEVDFGGSDCKWQHIGDWSLQAEQAQLLTRKSKMVTEEAEVQGQQLTQNWQRVRNLIQDFWHSGQRTWKQVRQSISRVEEVEQKDSGEHLHRVRNSLTIHSQRGSITSEKDLRVDAERIHMG